MNHLGGRFCYRLCHSKILLKIKSEISSINSAYVWKILAESVWPSGKNRGSHYQGQNSDPLNCPVTSGIFILSVPYFTDL